MTDDRDMIREKDCAACGRRGPSDPAHIKSRGAGAKNTESEMLPLCRLCHIFQHSKGWLALSNKYPHIRLHLKLKGWEFEDLNGVTKLRRV